MKIRFLNKTVSHQRYQYNPRYYDERKERLRAKKKQYEELEKSDVSDDRRKEIFKENLQGEWSRAQHRQNTNRTSNFRVMLLIVIILVLGYFIFNGVDEVDTVVKKLW
ncbi:MAG TPA: hypothetical protein EYG86_00495 [Crocinitomicaceae bacterium]|nr:hypothetical protein [Crocinitomicaceae bacterium]